MKSKVLLILILILSLVLTACTAVIVEDPNVTDTKDVSDSTAIESTDEDTSGETTTVNMDNTAVDTTETETTEADTTEGEVTTELLTTEPEDTTGPDEIISVIPDQSYVGGWAYYPWMKDGSITINSIDSEKVSFSYIEYKGPSVKATAILQDGVYVFGEDISPDLEYTIYDYVTYSLPQKVSGRLIFSENAVKIIFDEPLEYVTSVACNIKGESILKLEDHISSVKTTLENKNWTDSAHSYHDLSSESSWPFPSDREWYDNIEPYMPKEALISSVIATSGDLTAVIRLVYDRETDEWFTADAYYASTSGKVLQGKALETFMTDHGKTDFILSADDADLIEYFK